MIYPSDLPQYIILTRPQFFVNVGLLCLASAGMAGSLVWMVML